MKLRTGWVTHVGLTSESFPCLGNQLIVQRLLSEHGRGEKKKGASYMVSTLVTSVWLPTKGIGVHLPSRPHFPLVSAQMDGHLLVKLPLLIFQFPLPN